MINPNILCVIPARSGSIRLPNKNIKSLNGKPLIEWTIESALKVNLISQVIVTTNDDFIIEIAQKYGIEPPFKRPEELCTDNSTTFDVVKHTIDFVLANFDKKFDFVLLLQPTSPLRTAQSIISAIELLINKNADAVVSVTQCEHSPLWTNTLNEDLLMSNFLDEKVLNKRSQDLPIYYRLNGAIYLCSVSEFLKQKTFFIKENIYAYKMTNQESIDIDTLVDFYLAEALMKVSDES